MREDKSHTAPAAPPQNQGSLDPNAEAVSPLIDALAPRDLRPWFALIFVAVATTLLSLRWPIIRWLALLVVVGLGLRAFLGFMAARAMSEDPERH